MKTMQTFNDWVTFPKPNPQAKLRLFCFPYAGGSALNFRSWFDKLPLTVEVCPIELPGRGTRLREPLFTQLLPLIQAIACALLPYLNKPFTFFGHSMGGLISFELARLLCRDYGRSPTHLFISGYKAPHLPDFNPPIHNLPEPLFLEKLRELNGTPNEVLAHKELMGLFIPILKADLTILETYVYAPEPRLNCPIAVFSGLQDRGINCNDLKAWQEQTNASFSLQMLPGDHFFLHSAQSLLLQFLSSKLQQISSEV